MQKQPKVHKNRAQKERIKLDQIMQVLFKLSKHLTIELINGLFNESFISSEVEVIYGNSEFISSDLERIIGDLFITVESTYKTDHYHLEFQTLNDHTMVIRMFRYGLEKALEHAKLTNTLMNEPHTKQVLIFPQQLVIFLEENAAIQDSLSFTLQLAHGQELDYDVAVMKCWKHTPESLKNQRLYALLPLLVFQSRKELKKISSSKQSLAVKRQLYAVEFDRLKGIIQRTLEVLGELYDEKIIKGSDLEQILNIIQNITDYLYNRYGEYDTLEKEVEQMRKFKFDSKISEESMEKGKQEGIKEGIKEGKQEVAKQMLLKGLNISTIAEVTGFTEDEVTQLQEV